MNQRIASAGVFTYNAMNALNSLLSSLGIVTQGNVYWVNPRTGTDSIQGNSGQTPDVAFRSVRFALEQCTANQNDVVVLCAAGNTAANTTDYLSENLEWKKDLVHLVGVNAGSFCSPRSRISNSATATVFANLFTVSANGCLIYGVEFYQGAGPTTLAAASTCVTVTGQRNVFRNCAISGIGDTTRDYAGSNSLTIGGGTVQASENRFQGCYIGLNTVVRGTAATYEVRIQGSTTALMPARTIFEDCHFDSYANTTSWRAVSIGANVDRFVKFKNCEFSASVNLPGVAIPAGALVVGAMNGAVYINNPAMFGYPLLVSGGSAYVKVQTYQAATTTQGVAQSAAAS